MPVPQYPAVALLFPTNSTSLESSDARRIQRSLGARLARNIAAALTNVSPIAVAWARDSLVTKPRAELASRPGEPIIAANLSYAEGAIACAYLADARRNIGVDILSLNRAVHVSSQAASLLGGALLQPIEGTRECDSVLSALTPEQFAVRWTLLEALLKLRGTGLSVPHAAHAVLSNCRAASPSTIDHDFKIFGWIVHETELLDDRVPEFAAVCSEESCTTRIEPRIIGTWESKSMTWRAVSFAIERNGRESLVASLAWDS